MRKVIKVKDVKVGDELLLDYYHMDERIHKVLDIQSTLPLFPEDGETVSFYVKCSGEKFFTYSMNVNHNITINRFLQFEN